MNIKQAIAPGRRDDGNLTAAKIAADLVADGG